GSSRSRASTTSSTCGAWTPRTSRPARNGTPSARPSGAIARSRPPTASNAASIDPCADKPASSRQGPARMTEPTSSVTQTLATSMSGLTLDAVPADTQERAKALLLDSIACALAADQGEEMAQIASLADNAHA